MLLTDLYWPAHEMIERLYKSDQMETVSYHLATRLLRILVDQAAAGLTIPEIRTKTLFAACGPSQGEELAVHRWPWTCSRPTGTTYRLPAAEIPPTVGPGPGPGSSPRTCCCCLPWPPATCRGSGRSSTPSKKSPPATRPRSWWAAVFNRADGLAEEIGADQWAYSPADLVDLLVTSAQEAQEVAPAARGNGPAGRCEQEEESLCAAA